MGAPPLGGGSAPPQLPLRALEADLTPLDPVSTVERPDWMEGLDLEVTYESDHVMITVVEITDTPRLPRAAGTHPPAPGQLGAGR